MKPDRKCAENAILQISSQQPSQCRPRFRRAAVSRACVGSVIRESRSVQTFSDPHCGSRRPEPPAARRNFQAKQAIGQGTRCPWQAVKMSFLHTWQSDCQHLQIFFSIPNGSNLRKPLLEQLNPSKCVQMLNTPNCMFECIRQNDGKDKGWASKWQTRRVYKILFFRRK